jgi:hypothetical protein
MGDNSNMVDVVGDHKPVTRKEIAAYIFLILSAAAVIATAIFH